MDWIESAGYPVKRIADHKDWFNQFKAKLSALPEEKRQHSALEVLAAFSRPYPAKLRVADSANYQKLVQELGGKTTVPSLSEAFIHKCLADMRLLGQL